MNCYRPHSPVTMVPLRFSMKREAPNVFQEQIISCLVTQTSWIALSTTRPDNGEKNNVEGGCVMEEKTGKQIRRQGGGGGLAGNRIGAATCTVAARSVIDSSPHATRFHRLCRLLAATATTHHPHQRPNQIRKGKPGKKLALNSRFQWRPLFNETM